MEDRRTVDTDGMAAILNLIEFDRLRESGNAARTACTSLAVSLSECVSIKECFLMRSSRYESKFTDNDGAL